jgi:hypothetical protein
MKIKSYHYELEAKLGLIDGLLEVSIMDKFIFYAQEGSKDDP